MSSNIQIHVIGSAAFHVFAKQFFNSGTRFHPPFYLADPLHLEQDTVLIIEKECGEMHQAEEANLKRSAKNMRCRLAKVEKENFTIFLFASQYSSIREVLTVLN